MTNGPNSFCGKVYGYVAPPTLAIFIDDSPVSPTVRAALDSFIRTKQMAPPGGLEWQPRETEEYVNRATVIEHERRHFHDLLATQIGNHLFLSSLALTIHLLGGGDPRESVSVPTCPDFRDLYRRNVKLMEASALFAQIALTSFSLDDDKSEGAAVTAQMLSFMEPEPSRRPYNDFLRALLGVFSKLGMDPAVLGDVALLVFAMLCDVPTSELDDGHFLTYLRKIASPSLSREAGAKDLRDYARRSCERSMMSLARGSETTDPWRVRIEADLRATGAAHSVLMRDALDDFTSHALAIQAEVLDSPTMYADPGSYLRKADKHVQPLQIRIARNETPRVTQPVANVRYVRRDIWIQFYEGVSRASFAAAGPTL